MKNITFANVDIKNFNFEKFQKICGFVNSSLEILSKYNINLDPEKFDFRVFDNDASHLAFHTIGPRNNVVFCLICGTDEELDYVNAGSLTDKLEKTERQKLYSELKELVKNYREN